jgi:hypothetical protein
MEAWPLLTRKVFPARRNAMMTRNEHVDLKQPAFFNRRRAPMVITMLVMLFNKFNKSNVLQ